MLTPNESEAELLTGVTLDGTASVARVATELLSRGVQNAIITLGSRGAYVAGKDASRMIAGYNVKALDTTAAGDFFNGALAVALAEGKTLVEAARFANAAAAISVTLSGRADLGPDPQRNRAHAGHGQSRATGVLHRFRRPTERTAFAPSP